MNTTADRPQTRLLKTKMFVEQLIVRRKKNGPPGTWDQPTVQSKALDQAMNDWVDQTGNEIVAVTAPGMFMQWMDQERMTRLVICSAIVTYIPAVQPPRPLSQSPDVPPGWEPAIVSGLSSHSDERDK